MREQLIFEPLQVDHLDELAGVLLHPAVYQHIEETVPTIEEFRLGLERAIAGPNASMGDERWLNYLVRRWDGPMVGRLEATIHHGLAEVAFLFGPQYWGQGFATTGLRWLQEELTHRTAIADFWATTTPANVRSQNLLHRCGYQRADLPETSLYSYDPGDLVFRYRSTAYTYMA